MRPISRQESVGSRRARRVAVILLILLLIGLPLYLWPLRGAIPGLPGAAALSGPPSDPRSAKAVAQLPADVWEGLMGHGRPPTRSSGGHTARGNLTRIAPHEESEADGSLGSGSGGSFPRLDPGSTSPMSALLVDSSAGSGGDSSGGSSGDSTWSPGSTSGTFPGGGGSGGQGGGGVWSPFPGGVGPFGGGGGPGGGEGSAPPTFVADPSPDDPPMATPEPGTLLLVGFNLTVAGAVAWRRLNRGRECKPSG